MEEHKEKIRKAKLATVGGELGPFHNEIKQILQQARSKVQTAVNSAMVITYWQIGKRIVEEEQQGEKKAKYDTRLLENLSRELSQEFGKGFSYANLRNFRQFYLPIPIRKFATRCVASWKGDVYEFNE